MAKKADYTQVVHKDCGGAIILISKDGIEGHLACEKCNKTVMKPLPIWGNMILYKPGKL